MIISPLFARRMDELSSASDRVWIAGMTIGLVLTLIAAFVPLPPTGGTMCAYLALLVRSALYASAGETLRSRGGDVIAGLFAMGIVAGLFELLVDWWLVHGIVNGRLEYLGEHDVVLLASPIWMPVAWACIIVDLGYLAVRMFARLRAGMGDRGAAIVTSSIVAISAGIIVGFYEYFAFRAGWWRYAPAHAMIGSFCALFIPLGEAFMFLAILPIAARALSRDDRPVASVIVAGASFSVAILAGYALAYLLLEYGRAP